jgi:hypothetical protein
LAVVAPAGVGVVGLGVAGLGVGLGDGVSVGLGDGVSVGLGEGEAVLLPPHEGAHTTLAGQSHTIALALNLSPLWQLVTVAAPALHCRKVAHVESKGLAKRPVLPAQ